MLVDFFPSVVSFVRWAFILRHPASWLSVRTAPPVWRRRGLRSVSACRASRVRAARSWSVLTSWTEILTFSCRTSRTGLKPTSHCRWGDGVARRWHHRHRLSAVTDAQTHSDRRIFTCLCVFQVSTAEENGILLYNGDNEPIAVELHQGHVRVTYDPGNQPATAIYRWHTLS